jgi:hypothetical protein
LENDASWVLLASLLDELVGAGLLVASYLMRRFGHSFPLAHSV